MACNHIARILEMLHKARGENNVVFPVGGKREEIPVDAPYGTLRQTVPLLEIAHHRFVDVEIEYGHVEDTLPVKIGRMYSRESANLDKAEAPGEFRHKLLEYHLVGNLVVLVIAPIAVPEFLVRYLVLILHTSVI